MLTISKEFVFDAAHKLYRNDLTPEENREIFGKCCKLHGHTYRLIVTVSGETGPNGMIIHFSELKKIVHDSVLSRYDHSLLNELEEYRDNLSTAENMVVHIFDVLETSLKPANVTVESVTLYETPTSRATKTRDA